MHFSNVTLPCHPLCSEKEWCEIVKKEEKKKLLVFRTSWDVQRKRKLNLWYADMVFNTI